MGRPDSGFDKQFAVIKKNFATDKDKEVINTFIKDHLQETIADLKEFNKQMSVKVQLAEVSEIISLSYIAGKYFKKTSQWLYARINNNNVNGKPVAFKPDEIQTLNFAIEDISKKLAQTKVSL